MKVLSYLQLMLETAKLNSGNMPPKASRGDSCLEFYSQPFKPELITELFEGWEFENSVAYYMDGKNVIAIEKYDELMITYDDSTWWHFPRTLDDFINDCQRTGIELEWKK